MHTRSNFFYPGSCFKCFCLTCPELVFSLADINHLLSFAFLQQSLVDICPCLTKIGHLLFVVYLLFVFFHLIFVICCKVTRKHLSILVGDRSPFCQHRGGNTRPQGAIRPFCFPLIRKYLFLLKNSQIASRFIHMFHSDRLSIKITTSRHSNIFIQ